jgi:hypothetical protein
MNTFRDCIFWCIICQILIAFIPIPQGFKMRRKYLQAILSSALLAFLARVAPPAYSIEMKDKTISFSPLLKLEFSDHFNFFDPLGKFGSDIFKITAGTNALSFQYSNQAPILFGGKQFLILPMGYDLAEIDLKRKWGSLSVFRSLGYNSRFVQPATARALTGVALLAPKSFWGTQVSGYVLQASPAESGQALSSENNAQAGFTVMKEFKKGFKIQSEFTQSRQFAETANAQNTSAPGLFSQFTGKVAKADLIFSYRNQGEGFTNPAIPMPGQNRNLFTANVQRTFKKFRIEYSDQWDSTAEGRIRQLPSINIHTKSVRWTYSTKRWPQFSATGTWIAWGFDARREREENLQFSLNKALRRLTLGMSYLNGRRRDIVGSDALLWDRSGVMADAGVEVKKNRRINFHFENTVMRFPAASQSVFSQVLQCNTRMPFMADRFAFLPMLEYRYNWDNLGVLDNAFVRLALPVSIKLPRFMRISDILLTSSIEHATVLGQPARTTPGLVFGWNFRRL